MITLITILIITLWTANNRGVHLPAWPCICSNPLCQGGPFSSHHHHHHLTMHLFQPSQVGWAFLNSHRQSHHLIMALVQVGTSNPLVRVCLFHHLPYSHRSTFCKRESSQQSQKIHWSQVICILWLQILVDAMSTLIQFSCSLWACIRCWEGLRTRESDALFQNQMHSRVTHDADCQGQGGPAKYLLSYGRKNQFKIWLISKLKVKQAVWYQPSK